LLGDRSTNPTQASTWDRHALAIEHYRHHALGLPYGTDADRTSASPCVRALGTPTGNATERRLHAQLASLQATLDISIGM